MFMKLFYNYSKKILIFIIVAFSIFSLFASKEVQAASFNANELISDGEFININAMNAGDIQRFLESKGSFLKDYSENGRSAAQIIYDASHGYGEASGPPPNGCYNNICINTSTGTVNPRVLLVTLQKEQSLITMTEKNDDALRAAMGYGCPDGGGCYSEYAGFTNQVEWAAWQFRYNYEGSVNSPSGFGAYTVGNNIHFYNTYPNPYGGPSEQDVHIDNRATASLYRYTPHVYNGNYNFWRLYDQWFVQKEYSASLVSQSSYPSMSRDQTTSIEVKFRNTGTATWYATGDHPVRLALDRYWADRTAWQGSGWISENRLATAVEGTVIPGDVGTFRFNIHCNSDMSFGEHKFYVRLVSENLTWFIDPDTNGAAWWNINVARPQAQLTGQSAYPVAWPGDEVNLSATFKNTGSSTWSSSNSPVRLAVDRYQDESFLNQFKSNSWIADYRIANLPANEVVPGQSATFNFTIKFPDNLSPGHYRFYVRLVSEGSTWFIDPDTNGACWWDIIIPEPKAELVSQSSYPTLNKGDNTTLQIKFKNTSGATWKTGGPHPVRLALDRLWADKTAWQGSGWLSENRISSAVEGDVSDGQTATFNVPIHVNSDMPSGKHRFYVRLVSDGFSWFTNPDTNGAGWWEINVN